MRGKIGASLIVLHHLKYLDLSGNNLGGVGVPLPRFLGSLKSLIYLNLSSTNFDGTVTPQLGNLSRLQYLDINSCWNDNANDMQSKDISWLQRLPLLRALSLRECRLAFTYAPIVHSNLTSLEMVDLSDNGLDTLNPTKWFWHPSTIRHLDLTNNNIVGLLPDAVGNMTSLEVLRLGGNQLSDVKVSPLKNLCNLRELAFGGIPNWINRWTNLSVLQLSSNRLVGSIPQEIGMLSKLRILYLDDNQFNGYISEEHLANLANLEELDLSYNSLTAYFPRCKMGPHFPLWLKGQRDVIFLDISDAGIVDDLPDWFWTVFSNIQYMNISCNKISGRLPRTLDLTGILPQLPRHLAELDISKNSLSGPLPQKFGGPFLTDLLLSENHISGTIPSYICQLQLLSVLDLAKNHLMSSLILHNNNLSGEFPLFLLSCPQLILLDLAHNIYVGLRNNVFSGSIPVELKDLGYLQFLDLAHNRISGSIPDSLATLKAMTQDQAGEIPNEITSLVGLMSLNISHNQLSGEIPEKIGQLQSLESLDLSWNKLSGQIPSSLSGMTMLSKLNLSYNNLSGRIPSGNQLQTLIDPASSYIGNNYLCGPPVSRNCSGPEMAMARGHQDEHQPDSDVSYLYLGMAVGFVFALWVFFVTFLFVRTWRAAYFQMFDKLQCRLETSVAANFRRFPGKLYGK
ncbi:hypothetical protein HU200_050131 [Digitaria exilis]|uniref:Disease resistance R13L4/SHOC-2-like LRR domain-containing protein n=1 Tax=Digitaria exilis TaxID=1010633 RepID=A0A835EAE9_9POAL|nr:hypothetical protein HU200_050131 [Digitaria exilis]